MEKLEIQYYLHNSLHTFTVENFILENDDEIVLVGYDSMCGKLTSMGLVSNSKNEFFLYHIYFIDSKIYDAIISAENGTKWSLNQNSKNLNLRPEFTKIVNIPSKFKYFLTDSSIELIRASMLFPVRFAKFSGESPMESSGAQSMYSVQLEKPIY